jgi:hypothetical protein
VRAVDADVAHQRRAVRGVPVHAARAVHRPAAAEPGAVVVEQPVPPGERRLPQERLRPARADAPVDEHDRLARAVHLVRELDAADRRALHVLGSG